MPSSPKNRARRRRRAAVPLVLAGFAAGVAITALPGQILPTSAQSVHPMGSAAPGTTRTITRTSGTSHVADPEGGDQGVTMRTCPLAVDPRDPAELTKVGVPCSLQERLANGTEVQMRCWTDSGGPYSVPKGFKSARWFYVTELNGPHPNHSGYVYSEMIKFEEQIVTPACSKEILARYPFEGPAAQSADPRLEITGSCTTAGGTLGSNSSGFTPGSVYYIKATYPDGRDYTALKSEVTARDDGSIPWSWPCQGDPPGTYTTEIVTMIGQPVIDPVTFAIGPKATTVPRPVTTPPTPSALPATRNIAVFNKVTDGATNMREDTPAYLSSVTRNYCRDNGCLLQGTGFFQTGDVLTAKCQVQGDRTTNGNDGSAVDDGNPGLFSSTRWYGVAGPSGRLGYISEVWIRSADRGGLGLPGC